MSQDVKVQAAKLLKIAAKLLAENPTYAWLDEIYYRGCCSVLWTARVKGSFDSATFGLARRVFMGLYEQYIRHDGYYWPRTEEYVNVRVIALLFAAHFVLEG